MNNRILKIGKVPEKVLQRLVFSAKSYPRTEVLQGPMLGEDCAVVELDSDEVMILSTDPITATEENIGYLSVHITLNDLAAAGATPIGLMVTALLPPNYPEVKLEQIFAELLQTANHHQLALLGGHTEVTDAVNQVIISVTGVGKIKKQKALINKKIKAGDKIVMTKYAGLEGTSIIAKEKVEELRAEFSDDFLRQAQELDRFISVLEESKVAMESEKAGIKAMHDITEGGVLGALWELSSKANKGISIDLEAVPILRETIEITEFYDINPYKLISSGSMLIIAEKPEILLENLEKAGIPAKVVGELLESKEKIVHYSGINQALLSPEADELYKVL